MKNNKLLYAVLSIIMSIIIGSSSFAQTDSYSCKMIYGDNVNHALPGVLVDLYDSNDEMIGTTYTGDDGFFTFDDLTIGESYTARFSYDVENDFVDLADAFTLLGHLFNYIQLSDLELLAADVDASNEVDFDDFWQVLYYYVFDIPFPAGAWILPDWEFDMTASKLTGGPGGLYGTGDLDNDPDKSNHYIQLDYNKLVDFNTTELVVPIFFNETISTNGIGLVLGYNSELIEVTGIESAIDIQSEIDSLKYSIKDGVIKIGWTNCFNTHKFSNEDPIIKIHIKQNLALSNSQIEKFELLEGTHILDKSGKKYPFINFTSSEFKLSEATTLSTITESAYPNPCRDSFTISIADQKSNTADIQIYNSLGQLVKSEFLQVSNEKLTVSTQDLNAGIYIYHINIQSKLISGTISIR